MNDVDLTNLRDFIIIAAFLGGFILQWLKYRNSASGNPPSATTEAELKTKVAQLESSLLQKQDALLCTSLHKELERDLGEISSRHARHEDKISAQVGDVHRRIDNQTAAISKLDGTLATFMVEIRNWRSNHDAKNNHP